MNIRLAYFIIILFSITSTAYYAQNQSPVVQNVTLAQRTDGSFIVDVNYYVNDADGNSMTVTIKVSDDNGITWNYSCNNVTGDVGSGINNGANKHITWNFGAEHPETFGDQFKVKIIADDGSVIMGIPCPGLPSITDPRDGQEYETVWIDPQCWLKENLDVGTRINGSQIQADNGNIEKYCYDDNFENCELYGGLYQWNEAMQYVTSQGAKGICPDGWHIPTFTEFESLITTVNNDGNALKAVGQGFGDGIGTNESGFNALLAGYRKFDDGVFHNLRSYTDIWSSNMHTFVGSAKCLNLNYYDRNIGLGYNHSTHGFSVRCLKD